MLPALHCDTPTGVLQMLYMLQVSQLLINAHADYAAFLVISLRCF